VVIFLTFSSRNSDKQTKERNSFAAQNKQKYHEEGKPQKEELFWEQKTYEFLEFSSQL